MRHLSKHERNEIQILRKKGHSLRDVATVLERNVSTISREVKRNKVKGKYSAKKAQMKAYQRRHVRKIQMKKIRRNDELENYIREKLKLRRTTTTHSLSTEYRTPRLQDRICYHLQICLF